MIRIKRKATITLQRWDGAHETFEANIGTASFVTFEYWHLTGHIDSIFIGEHDTKANPHVSGQEARSNVGVRLWVRAEDIVSADATAFFCDQCRTVITDQTIGCRCAPNKMQPMRWTNSPKDNAELRALQQKQLEAAERMHHQEMLKRAEAIYGTDDNPMTDPWL